MKKVFLILIGIWFLAGCQKLEVDLDDLGTPVFKAVFSVDGASKSLIAGDDDYYLFTGKNSALGVPEFYGILREENCQADCQPEVKISFKTNDIEKLFSNKIIDFEEVGTTVKPIIKVRFDAAPYGVAPFENTWIFEDNTTLTGDHVFKEFEENTSTTVQLVTVDGNGCENRQERTLEFIDFPGASSSGCEDFTFFIDPQPDSSGFTNGIFIVPFGVESTSFPDSLVWNDGTSNFFFCFQPDSIPDVICVDIFSFSGCPPQTICLNLKETSADPGFPQFCATQFSYSDEIIFSSVPQVFEETVMIEYSENGTVYYSNILPQTGSIFEVTSFESYDANENGNPTLMYSATFSCQLASLDGDVIEIESEQVVFAVER